MNNFIQISDCHIDDTKISMNVDTHQRLTTIVKKITSIDTNAVLISGDLTHNGSNNAYQIIKKILSPIKTKLLVLPGNHDNKVNLTATFKDCLFEKFTLGLWDIISLDSVQPDKVSGHLSVDKLNRLNTLLQQSSIQHIIITIHHPIMPINNDWDNSLSLENPDDLFAVLDKYPKIRAVLFGHAHQAVEFTRHQVKIICCPSTALQYNNDNRIGFNHYTLHNNGQLNYYTQWM